MILCKHANRFRLLYILGLLVLTHSVFAVTPQPNYQQLITDLNQLRQRHHTPAYAVHIVSGTKSLFLHAEGLSDRRTNKQATVDTVFRVGSITKSFTALALLQLQAQGKVKLSDPVRLHLADAPIDNAWQKTNPVTLEQLMEHTSGLLDLSKTEFDHSDPTPLTLREGLYYGEPRKIVWQPGLFSSYTNAGAGYVAYVLQKITNTSYEEYLRQNIFLPLNMHQASVTLTKNTKQKLATGYDIDGKTVIPYWHMIMRPFAGINTTPREMGSMVQMLMNYGRYNGRQIVSPEAVLRMEQPITSLAARSGLGYGYGLGSDQYVSQGHLFHGHGGDGDGYLAKYAYNRKLDRGYFLVINAFQNRAINQMKRVIEKFISQGHPAPKPAQKTLPEKVLAQYEGTFQKQTYRFPWSKNDSTDDKLSVVYDNGKLILRQDGTDDELVPVNTHHFRFKDEPVATMAFIKHSGELYFVGDVGNYRRVHTSISK